MSDYGFSIQEGKLCEQQVCVKCPICYEEITLSASEAHCQFVHICDKCRAVIMRLRHENERDW